ncbi:beta-N-acetylhexosaminidase [Lentibacillus saliphilus]|uniref:beta-N-acetylhexosaminidase n=1 Tax=Lentibacillus saliphilus TaxID=2737028 RepID=UPI001C303C2D|nr:beta-N-acetylhexosaminidase [Lentibacillus saliphilus]
MQITDVKKQIGQLMVCGFKGKTITPEIKKLIREHHVGGIILFARNIGTPQEVYQLTTDLQREAKVAGHEQPLLICIDQENGVVRRLGEGTTIFPGSMLIGATGRYENAYIAGLATGRELKALGINWNLAPVLDVNNNPDNPVIGVRSFGEDPDKVSKFGLESMKGMQAAGVITTLKHFPGHGDTSVDSHLDLPVISHDMNRLKNIELKPFIKCINEGADTIMSAHVYFPAIEGEANVPATLSNKVITGLLREQLGYKGVVTTDCMEMNAISETIGTAGGGVAALKAGVDLIMVSHLQSRQYETMDQIERAVISGEIKENTLNEAFNRVMQLKKKYLSWEDISFESHLSKSTNLKSKHHEAEATEIYKQGITVVKNEHKLLPLNIQPEDKVLVLYPENKYAMQVEDSRYATFSLGESIKRYHSSTDILQLSNPPTKEEIDQVGVACKGYKAVIIGTLSVQPGDAQAELVHTVTQHHKTVIVVATRSPYDLAYLPDVQAYIATYEFTKPALEVATQAIFGITHVKGHLPVTLPRREEG